MLSDVLKEYGFSYTIAFRFKNERGTRTTHALVYVAKDPKGLSIMKTIMASESSTFNHGVPSYVYCPADAAATLQLDLCNPIIDLANKLSENYAGKQITVGDLIAKEEPKGPPHYLDRNYKDAINRLEEAGYIDADPPAARRQRGGKTTFGPKVVLTFPVRRTA